MSTINASTIDIAKNPNQVTRAAQSQWFSRPEDHKFESLEKLAAAVQSRRSRSTEYEVDSREFRFAADGRDPNNIITRVPLGLKKPTLSLSPTHFSFSQACSLVGLPAAAFRDKLSDRRDIVIEALNHCYNKRASEPVKVLGITPHDTDPNPFAMERLQAVTSTKYGRIWDADVVGAAKNIIARTGDRFHSPLDWGRKKRALFASDRDIFMFFIDGGSIVEGGGERDQLHRGWFMWNSEVGTETFGIACFLFRQVCGNFGIWGAQDVRVLKIRHSSGGPARFVNEAVPALQHYLTMSAKPIEDAVRQAKALLLPKADDEFIEYFMKNRAAKFTRPEIKRAIEFADAEEGQHATLWDMYNGFTAAARMMAHVDAKTDLEKRAGKLMDVLVEAA